MEELTLADYINILKQRKKQFFLTFSVLWILSIIFALCWSNYRSVATVEVEQPTIAAETTTPIGASQGGTSGALADLRIDKIGQKVTAPGSLIEIITKLNLYPGAKQYTPMAALAKNMGNKIKITLLSSDVANPAATQKVNADELSAIAFTLSFDYSDPHIAQQVTDELVSRFLDEDLKERRAEAQATSDFLQTQILALEGTMAEQEKNIAEFQEAHGAARPEALAFNQQAAATTTFNLQSLDSQIAANEGTQGSLRAELAGVDPYSRVIADGQVLTTPRIQLKALEAQYSTLTAQYGPDHPDVVKARHQIESLKAQLGENNNSNNSEKKAQLKSQITDIKTNLQAAEKTYGPDHPDVVSLKNQLKDLQNQLSSIKNSSSTAGNVKQDADNPAYLELTAQLSAAQEQHKSLLEQKQALQAQQLKYQEAVTANPGAEQQMAALSRDYDNAQLRYRELKEKKMAADMEVQMEQDRKGERLIVINPPELPLKTHPSRLMLLFAGFFLSIAGGLGMVVLTHSTSQSVMGSQAVAHMLGVGPMVTVPYIVTLDERNRALRLRPYLIGSGFFLILFGAFVFNYAVMPLDVLFSMIAQRVGLS